MKSLLAICLIVTASFTWAAESAVAPNPHQSASLTGEVVEVKNVQNYTYMRLKHAGGETWAAVVTATVKKGQTVTIEKFSVMNDFHSKALNRTFPTILFGSLAGAETSAAVDAAPAPKASGGVLNTSYGMLPKAKLESINDAPVAKASGANAYTVAEIVGRAGELKGKQVVVRGKVVKYNAEIMGKNWVHLRDGTGSETDGSNDILVTTKAQARVGQVVTAKGVVHTDKDFGAGYAYKVLIEEATLR